jgi:hypothetical protein
MKYSIIVFIIITGLFSWIGQSWADPSPSLPSLNHILKATIQAEKKKTRVIQKKSRDTNTTIPEIQENITLPKTYSLIRGGKAINLYRYNSGNIWVQNISLEKWAKLASILDFDHYDTSTGEPLFKKSSLTEQWKNTKNNPFSIINGQFFDPRKSTTPLSFWLKVNNIILTAGADNRDEAKNIFTIKDWKAQILPYSWENLQKQTGDFAMVNLSLNQPHYHDEIIGRTYICIPHVNIGETGGNILIFTALAEDEVHTESLLTDWGCARENSTKLDSSGSSRLALTNNEYIYGYSHKGTPDYRKIPHAIVIYDEN